MSDSRFEEVISENNFKHYDHENFSDIQELGSGSNWKNSNQYLSIKKISNTDNATTKAIVHEIKLQREVYVNNSIICLFGVKKLPENCIDTLRDYLKENFNNLIWNDKFYQLAHAVSRLPNEGIVNSNLHSNNVLIHQNLSNQSEIIPYVDKNRFMNEKYDLNERSNLHKVGVFYETYNFGLALQGVGKTPIPGTAKACIKLHTESVKVLKISSNEREKINNNVTSFNNRENHESDILEEPLSAVVEEDKKDKNGVLIKLNIINVEVVNLILKMVNEERRLKDHILDYCCKNHISLQEVYNWLLNNLDSIHGNFDFSEFGTSIKSLHNKAQYNLANGKGTIVNNGYLELFRKSTEGNYPYRIIMLGHEQKTSMYKDGEIVGGGYNNPRTTYLSEREYSNLIIGGTYMLYKIEDRIGISGSYLSAAKFMLGEDVLEKLYKISDFNKLELCQGAEKFVNENETNSEEIVEEDKSGEVIKDVVEESTDSDRESANDEEEEVDLSKIDFSKIPKRKGLQNLGNTCFMNSILQALFNSVEFRNRILQTTTTRLKTSTTYQLQLCFAHMMFSPKSYFSPSALLETLPSSLNHGQQDCHEFLKFLFCQIEDELKDSKKDKKDSENDVPICPFGGELENAIICLTCGNESKRKEEFHDLSLSLRIDKYNPSFSDLLSEFLSDEVLEGDNKYFCEKCSKLCDARKVIRIATPPRYLILSLNRFEYDMNCFRRIKIMMPVSIQDSISVAGDVMYDLSAILIHSSPSAEFGHYWTFAKDEENDEWHKYNDSYVSSTSLSTIISDGKQFEWDTPYLLFFQRKDDMNSKLLRISRSLINEVEKENDD